ncbi:MAG: T9SS type A sorting domain-containing protein, partial [Bacteroidota bacterium]
AGANGSITPNGVTSVACGGSQTYNIAANGSFAIQDVLVDGISVGVVSSYTFNNVTAIHTISVTFTTAVACTAPGISTSSVNVLCRNAATGSIILTTTGGTAPFSYSWTGPNNFTATTKDISGLLAGTYNLIVTATGGCTATGSVTITQPATALSGTIAAAAFACSGTTTTLTVSAAGGTGARQFSLNGGAYQTATTFTVTAAGSPYTVTVRDANNCTFTTNTLTLAPAPTTVPAIPAAIFGPNFGLCGGGSFTYSVNPVPTATQYVWTGPVGFTVTAGQNTTTATYAVPTSYTANNGGVWCVAKNACGGSPGLRYPVYSYLSYPASSMTGPSTVTIGQTGVQYSLPAATGATFNWLVPTGASVTSGQGTNTITVTFGSTSGNVSCDITNGCGVGPRVTRAVTFITSRPTSQTTAQKTFAEQSIAAESNFDIYPNPAQDNAAVVFGSAKAGDKFELVITNTLGKTILSKSGVTTAGTNILHFDLSNLKHGMYLVRLVTAGAVQTQKLVKGK